MANLDTRVVVGKFHGGSLMGPVWTIGWLFTIGFAHLHLVKGFLALILWPYFLGQVLAHP